MIIHKDRFFILLAITWLFFPAQSLFSQEHRVYSPHELRTPSTQNSLKMPSDCSGDETIISPDYEPVDTLTIRVVFHVIHSISGLGMLDEEDITKQMQLLNDHFASVTNPDGTPHPGSKIVFELATEAPDGSPTTGINYVQNDPWFHGEIEVYGPELMWDSSRYMNVFTIRSFVKPYSGRTPFHGWESDIDPNTDGIILGYEYASNTTHIEGPTSALSKITGFYLGLYSTYGREPTECAEGDCFKTGDRICDTNPMTFPEAFECQDAQSCGAPEPFDNIMSFAPEDCSLHFTPQQVNRLRCSLANYRSGIVSKRTPPEPLPKRWIPHLTSPTGGFETELFLTNTSDQMQEITLNGYDQQGQPIEETSFALEAGTRQIVGQSDAFTVTQPSHAAISGSEQIVVSYGYKVANQSGVSAHLVEISTPGQTFMMHLGETEFVFDGIAMLNVGDGPATVTAELLEIDGSQSEPAALVENLPIGGKGLADLATFLPETTKGMVKISSDQPILMIGLRGSKPGADLPFLFYNPLIPLP